MKDAAITLTLLENLPCAVTAEEPGGHTVGRIFSTSRGDIFKPISIFMGMQKLHLLTGHMRSKHAHSTSKPCEQLLWVNLEAFLQTLQVQ